MVGINQPNSGPAPFWQRTRQLIHSLQADSTSWLELELSPYDEQAQATLPLRQDRRRKVPFSLVCFGGAHLFLEAETWYLKLLWDWHYLDKHQLWISYDGDWVSVDLSWRCIVYAFMHVSLYFLSRHAMKSHVSHKGLPLKYFSPSPYWKKATLKEFLLQYDWPNSEYASYCIPPCPTTSDGLCNGCSLESLPTKSPFSISIRVL